MESSADGRGRCLWDLCRLTLAMAEEASWDEIAEALRQMHDDGGRWWGDAMNSG